MKVRSGGSKTPIIIARRMDTESDFQTALEADPELDSRYGALIERMASLQDIKRDGAAVTGAFSAFGNPFIDGSTIIRGFFALQVIAMRQGGAPAEDIDGMMDVVRETPNMPADLDALLIADRFQEMVDFLGPTIRR